MQFGFQSIRMFLRGCIICTKIQGIELLFGSPTLLLILVSGFRRFYMTISRNSTFRASSESYSVGQLELVHLLSV